jgi:hypothetical protein
LLDFKKILQCIARFGDELHLQATHEGVSGVTFGNQERELIRRFFFSYQATNGNSEHLEDRILPVLACVWRIRKVQVDWQGCEWLGGNQMQVASQGMF